jgi:hypothetical protein
MGMDENSHQDGIIAKYIIAKGQPDTLKINVIRLAKYMGSRLPEGVIASLSKEQAIDLSRKGYNRDLWSRSRWDLRTAVISQRVLVNGIGYSAKRVEGSFPGYEIVLEREGLEDNGTH